MNIKYLGPYNRLVDILEDSGHIVERTESRITEGELKGDEFIISYGYRHILTNDILNKVNGRAINLHISYLPFNRGADPNLWSYLEDSPKGVSIHYIDEGIDTGDIIYQMYTWDSEEDTLKSSYLRLKLCIENLFIACMERIFLGECPREKQNCKGSFHVLSDKDKYAYLLEEKGFDTPVKELIGKVKS